MPEWNLDEVIFLNPRTCGIYKDGGMKYKVDAVTGRRTTEVDDELGEQVKEWLAGGSPAGMVRVPVDEVFERGVIVPRYYDPRWMEGYRRLLEQLGTKSVSLGELEDRGHIQVLPGHGSPSNDMRDGIIPYIKVSDLRALRVNVNPTNLVTEVVAKRLWGGDSSGLRAWDLITPNRASSNIGEFVILLPGEERIVLTKEVFVIRATDNGKAVGYDPFYLLWAFSLRVVRNQWRRVALMQTNREDVGDRYREIEVPHPLSQEWAKEASQPFRDYFITISEAKATFEERLRRSALEFIPAVYSMERHEGGESCELEALDD